MSSDFNMGDFMFPGNFMGRKTDQESMEVSKCICLIAKTKCGVIIQKYTISILIVQ